MAECTTSRLVPKQQRLDANRHLQLHAILFWSTPAAANRLHTSVSPSVAS